MVLSIHRWVNSIEKKNDELRGAQFCRTIMKHFLIVGGGIAGLTNAYFLLQEGQKVTLIDNDKNVSTAVAAGQINPMVFRRMTKSWRVDECLPFASSFFEHLDRGCSGKLIMRSSIRRMFSHEQEKDLWIKKQDDPKFADYLTPLTEEDRLFAQAKNICGSGRVKNSYYVNSQVFIQHLRDHIQAHSSGTFLIDEVDHSQFDIEAKNYKGEIFDAILFCEGYRNRYNPWFGKLPVNRTKGQILTIESETIYRLESLNRKCFLLPQGDGTFRVGSTYEWDSENLEITPEARQEIENNLQSLVDDKYRVVDQKAGIRPTTADRRPIIGEHPKHQGVYIFNGLGTKGYLLAPLLARENVDYILHQKSLHPEVSLERFNEYF